MEFTWQIWVIQTKTYIQYPSNTTQLSIIHVSHSHLKTYAHNKFVPVFFFFWCDVLVTERLLKSVFFLCILSFLHANNYFFFAFLHAFWSVWLIHFGIGFLTFDSLLNSLLCCFEVLGFSVTVLQLLTFDLWQLCLYIELSPTKKNIFRFYSFIYNS